MNARVLSRARQSCRSPLNQRALATSADARPLPAAKKEGDISSVFVSLSGGNAPQLSERFASIKRQLIAGNADRVRHSWDRLLSKLHQANDQVRREGPSIVPSIEYSDIHRAPIETVEAIKDRGVAVIRGVVPENEARAYKEEVERYVKLNPWTKGTALSHRAGWIAARLMTTNSIPKPRSPSLRALLVRSTSRRTIASQPH